MLDGRIGGGEAGTTLGPTLVEVGDHESELAREEVFGPVLALVRVPDLDAALEFTNGSRYGNAGAIFTSSGEAARLPLRRRSGDARRQHRVSRPGRLVPVRGVEGLPRRRPPRKWHRRGRLLHPEEGSYESLVDGFAIKRVAPQSPNVSPLRSALDHRSALASAFPINAPVIATIRPPIVTWISEDESETWRKRFRIHAIATSSQATVM